MPDQKIIYKTKDGQEIEVIAKEKKGEWESAGNNKRVYIEVGQVKSASGHGVYSIKRDENGKYSCGCPRWIYNAETDANGDRTCKHVKAYLATRGLEPDENLLELEGVQDRLKEFLDSLDEKNLEITVKKIRKILS